MQVQIYWDIKATPCWDEQDEPRYKFGKREEKKDKWGRVGAGGVSRGWHQLCFERNALWVWKTSYQGILGKPQWFQHLLWYLEIEVQTPPIPSPYLPIKKKIKHFVNCKQFFCLNLSYYACNHCDLKPLGPNQAFCQVFYSFTYVTANKYIWKGNLVVFTSSANFIKMVVRGLCWPSMGTKWAVTTAGKPALSKTPFKDKEKAP